MTTYRYRATFPITDPNLRLGDLRDEAVREFSAQAHRDAVHPRCEPVVIITDDNVIVEAPALPYADLPWYARQQVIAAAARAERPADDDGLDPVHTKRVAMVEQALALNPDATREQIVAHVGVSDSTLRRSLTLAGRTDLIVRTRAHVRAIDRAQHIADALAADPTVTCDVLARRFGVTKKALWYALDRTERDDLRIQLADNRRRTTPAA